MAKIPSGANGVNNYAKSEPRQSVSAQSKGLGAPIKTTVIAASATHAGHGQVNPGSTKGNTSVPAYASNITAVKHGATATQLGKKETGHP